MFDTRNDLPLGGRSPVVKLPNERLATALRPYPEGTTEGGAHLKALATLLAPYGAQVRAAIQAGTGLGDADTSDLCTGISPGADKYPWFREARLHGKR
jgi:DNA-binding ferritin-like protein